MIFCLIINIQQLILVKKTEYKKFFINKEKFEKTLFIKSNNF